MFDSCWNEVNGSLFSHLLSLFITNNLFECHALVLIRASNINHSHSVFSLWALVLGSRLPLVQRSEGSYLVHPTPTLFAWCEKPDNDMCEREWHYFTVSSSKNPSNCSQRVIPYLTWKEHILFFLLVFFFPFSPTIFDKTWTSSWDIWLCIITHYQCTHAHHSYSNLK